MGGEWETKSWGGRREGGERLGRVITRLGYNGKLAVSTVLEY